MDHLKADGWAESHCCSPRIEEVALFPEPRCRWGQMDIVVLVQISQSREFLGWRVQSSGGPQRLGLCLSSS